MFPCLTLHSASIGLMKGEPRMVCVLITWSSRSTWMSSTADTISVPYEVCLIQVDVNALYGSSWAATQPTCNIQYNIQDVILCMCLSYCISVWSERETQLSPFSFHLLHGFFKRVLLTG